MGQKWSVRAYREGDEDRIFELYKAVYPEKEYNHEKWLRWWRWMYKDNPAGPGRIWLAEHDGKIVGQHAIIPVEVKIGDKTVAGSLSLDAMTHPDYRRQKMFETLAKRVYDEAARGNTHLLYAILHANNFSYTGFIKKLNWFDVASMQIMLKPLNWRNVVTLKVNNNFLQRVLATGVNLVSNKVLIRTEKPPVTEGLTINQIASFDERFDEVWSKISNQFQIMVIRNKDYLNWRYSTPDVNYSIFVAEKASEIWGYVVSGYKIQSGVKVSRIFDMVAQSEEVMCCLISRLIEDCKQNRVDLIIYRLIANKTYRQVFKRNGFISVPFIKGFHLCAYSTSPSIHKEFLRNPQNWLVQTGDSDLV